MYHMPKINESMDQLKFLTMYRAIREQKVKCEAMNNNNNKKEFNIYISNKYKQNNNKSNKEIFIEPMNNIKNDPSPDYDFISSNCY